MLKDNIGEYNKRIDQTQRRANIAVYETHDRVGRMTGDALAQAAGSGLGIMSSAAQAQEDKIQSIGYDKIGKTREQEATAVEALRHQISEANRAIKSARFNQVVSLGKMAMGGYDAGIAHSMIGK